MQTTCKLRAGIRGSRRIRSSNRRSTLFRCARATAAHPVWNNCVIVKPAIYLGGFIRGCLFAECLRKLELQELGTCARASHSVTSVQLSRLKHCAEAKRLGCNRQKCRVRLRTMRMQGVGDQLTCESGVRRLRHVAATQAANERREPSCSHQIPFETPAKALAMITVRHRNEGRAQKKEHGTGARRARRIALCYARMQPQYISGIHIFCFSLRNGCGIVAFVLRGGAGGVALCCCLLSPSSLCAVAACRSGGVGGDADGGLLRSWEEGGVPLKSMVSAARLLRSSSMRALLLTDASSDPCD